ncbi:Small secreted protein [Neofusicoccum parvum]|uniref:Small secreted protein n=2 Tax=Neofusicoccum parvum TaxID=310453 RepID=A0ACB5RU82_9PEZI|nr:putative small secreted protein [Neofusicoccum parvum UCRNP2]GME24058.1 Small secreted protein [Neofusicoccum parvum]GME55609.1 Small secreted protein [Neofusicoccum parvum]
MRFSTVAVFLGLTASSLAAPVMDLPTGMTKRANSTSSNSNAAAAGGSVLTAQSYADFQISDGVAGNALAEVNQKFPISNQDPAQVSDADAEIISNAREVAEDAETGTGGFNDQIAAAGEDTDAGKALQVGKIKNKVLKLQLEIMDLQIKQAQGDDQTAKIAEEQTKLQSNIDQDTEAAGQTSQSVADTFKESN